jgi:hypothetical protein
VLALDATYRHNGNARATGHDTLDFNRVQSPPTIHLNSGSSEVFAFAPAIEYTWKSNLGVLLGTRVIPAAHNTHATITRRWRSTSSTDCGLASEILETQRSVVSCPQKRAATPCQRGRDYGRSFTEDTVCWSGPPDKLPLTKA